MTFAWVTFALYLGDDFRIVSKVCELTNHEKSEKHQELAAAQGQARLISISNKASVIFL